MEKKKYLKDIEGAVHLQLEHGDRFRGWYLFKKHLRDEYLPLEYPGHKANYNFSVYEYTAQWVMPMSLAFNEGTISYTDDERMLGVFRFPQREGRFSAPIMMRNVSEEVSNLSQEELENLLKNGKVLTFEAFRIPQFCFQYFFCEDKDFENISKITDGDFSTQMKDQYEQELSRKISEVKAKIEGQPNYLLILTDVLNLLRHDMTEVSKMTDSIIHI